MASGQAVLVRPRRLRDFDFGFASADTEASDRPELLRLGFLDHLGMIEVARQGRKFIFLGYKGSGKSALGERLVLIAENESQLFTRLINIADLSFQSFSQILQAGVEPEARYPTTWSWLLMLQFFDSFARDNGSNIASDNDLWLVSETLRELGLIPDPKLSETVSATLEKSFSLKIAGIIDIGAKTSSKQNTDLPLFVERLKQASARFKSESEHIIVVDGFDDLLRRRNLQYDALGALVFESHRLNSFFSRSRIPAKIVLLCRTDLFERLTGPNKNKMRQDFAVNLDWGYGHKDLKTAPLVELINRRASMKTLSPLDVFESFLPPHPDIRGKADIREYLLEHTRYVPRDIVMLFKSLQEYSGDDRMSLGQVFDALANYSKTYFVPEIKDELDGQLDGESISAAFRLFSSTRKQITKTEELEMRATELKYPASFDLKLVLRLLFDCSAIGNAGSAKSQSKDIRFKFKNKYAEFNELEYIVFHKALWKGLDLH